MPEGSDLLLRRFDLGTAARCSYCVCTEFSRQSDLMSQSLHIQGVPAMSAFAQFATNFDIARQPTPRFFFGAGVLTNCQCRKSIAS